MVEGTCRLQQALIKDKRFEHLFLLPAAQTKDKDAVKPEQIKEIIQQLKKDFDFVLIDCPAGIEQGFRNALAGADHAIIVATPEISSVRDADRVIGLIEAERHISSPRLVINRVRYNMMKKGEMLEVEEIVSILAIDLLGVVPDDEGVIKYSNLGEPIAMNPDTLGGLAYRNIGRRLLGETVPLMNLEEKKGMFKKLFGIK